MNDDEVTGRLLAPLRTDPTISSTVDLAGALSDGRRQARRRRAGGMIAVAGLTALAVAAVPVVLGANRDGRTVRPPVASPPPPPTQCAAAALPLPSGQSTAEVFAGDPSGRFLVGGPPTGWPYTKDPSPGSMNPGPGGPGKALLWDRGQVTVLDPPGNPDLLGYAVSSSGVVLITGREVVTGTLAERSWLYRDGVFASLSDLGYIGIDLNERGDILAYRQRAGRDAENVVVADYGRGAVRVLAPPAAARSDVFPTRLDDDGTVAAGVLFDVQLVSADDRAVVWAPDGVPSQLGPGETRDIRNGWVVGRRGDPGDVVRWHLPSGRTESFPGMSSVDAVNARGWMAGLGAGGPAVSYGGPPLTLPTAPGLEGTYPANAVAISDDGSMVGGNLSVNRFSIPVRWTCR